MKFLPIATVFSLGVSQIAISLEPAKGKEEDRVPPDAEKVEVAIDSPATNYRIQIQEIRKVGEEIWVLSKVSTVGDFGGQAITGIKDSVLIEKTGLPHKHFVEGKTWGWAEPKTVTYLPAGEGMTDEKWKAGKVIWVRRARGEAGAEDKG